MIEVNSTAFQPDGTIPISYTCDGLGLSPPLSWSGVPDDAISIAILVDDPDSSDHPFLHWLVTDIPPSVHTIDEGAAMPRESLITENDAGTASYYGPCPAVGRHHYHFHVYALDTALGRAPANRDEFFAAIAGHVIDEGDLVGTYERT